MGKSTINGHFPLQTVSSPEGSLWGYWPLDNRFMAATMCSPIRWPSNSLSHDFLFFFSNSCRKSMEIFTTMLNQQILHMETTHIYIYIYILIIHTHIYIYTHIMIRLPRDGVILMFQPLPLGALRALGPRHDQCPWYPWATSFWTILAFFWIDETKIDNATLVISTGYAIFVFILTILGGFCRHLSRLFWAEKKIGETEAENPRRKTGPALPCRSGEI